MIFQFSAKPGHFMHLTFWKNWHLLHIKGWRKGTGTEQVWVVSPHVLFGNFEVDRQTCSFPCEQPQKWSTFLSVEGMCDAHVISLSVSCFRPRTCPLKPCGWCWSGATMTCGCWTCPAKHWKLKAFLEATRYILWFLNCSFLVFVFTCCKRRGGMYGIGNG